MNSRPRVNHRKLKLSVGDIYLDSRKAKKEPSQRIISNSKPSDQFLSYKESCIDYVYYSGPLPVFKSVEKHQTIDLKRRLRSLESRPNRYKISNNKMRSQTIVTDDFESSFIRVPF